MSASLIGRRGQAHSDYAPLRTSLTGSCFSSELGTKATSSAKSGRLSTSFDAVLEPNLAGYSDLQSEVTQSAAQIVLDGDRLRLQQLSMGQQHSQFLTA